MSQLVARHGRNAAREAKRLKEIRKVKAAIKWHQQQREGAKQEIRKHRLDWKTIYNQQSRAKASAFQKKRQSLKNVKEDWQLGPLRPNRAVGKDGARYGAISDDENHERLAEIAAQEWMNKERERKGLEPKYPLIIDGERHFPLAQGDRVIVIRGRNKNQVGVIEETLNQESDLVSIKGVNQQYVDSHMFGHQTKEANIARKILQNVGVRNEDVRLLLSPGQTQLAENRGPVIVDKIVMERHATGIDPYTGTDYGDAKIPEEHQNDPKTGRPILHRYVAGTRERIPWPWEKKTKVVKTKTSKQATGKRKVKSRLTKVVHMIRHPIMSLRRWRSKGKKDIKTVQKKLPTSKAPTRPESQPRDTPDAWDITDTTRNIVEAEHSMAYTILAPPIPETLREELRDEIREMTLELKKDPDMPRSKVILSRTPAQEAQMQRSRQAKMALDRMKTPMQLRWEMEQAKKAQQQKTSPTVDMDHLLMMLGKHMQKNKVRIPYRQRVSQRANVD